MFNKGGPRPWHTKPGHSKLDGLIEEAREKKLAVTDVETHGIEKFPETGATTGSHV